MKKERSHIDVTLVIHGMSAFYRAVIRGASRFAKTRPNWHLWVLDVRARGLEELPLQRPEGAIAAVSGDRELEIVRRSGAKVVNLSATYKADGLYRVCNDLEKATRCCLDHLCEVSGEHLAVLQPWWAQARSVMVEQFCRSASRRGRSVHVFEHDQYQRQWQEDRGFWFAVRRQYRQWLMDLPKPVAVWVIDDYLAAAVLQLADECGFSIPRDVAVLGYGDDPDLCELTAPTLSSLRQPGERIGFEAAGVLDGLLSGQSPRPRDRRIEPIGIAARASTDLRRIDDPLVLEAIRYIESHLHERVNASDVVAHLAVGRSSFRQRFRVATGRTVLQEILQQRVDRAKRLLADSDSSLQQIALACGFRDATHLSKRFFAIEQETPRAYRCRFRLT